MGISEYLPVRWVSCCCAVLMGGHALLRSSSDLVGLSTPPNHTLAICIEIFDTLRAVNYLRHVPPFLRWSALGRYNGLEESDAPDVY